MRYLLAVLLLAALPARAEPFRIIVTDLETPLVVNSVFDLALREGYFTREGVEVEFVRVQQTPMALAALGAGEGEMANVGTDALLMQVVRGADDLRAVGSTDKALPFLIARRAGVALDGARYGVGRVGSVDHVLSMRVLEGQGVAVEGLQILPLGQPPVRAQALLAGEIDATTMSIGTWLALPSHDGLEVVVDPAAYRAAVPVVTKVNAVTQAVLEDRGDDLQAVLAALTLAARDFAAKPETWVDAMARARPDVSRATLEELSVAYAKAWSVNGGVQRQELEETAAWMFDTEDFAGLTPPAMAQWVDFVPMDAVLARIGTAEGMDAISR